MRLIGSILIVGITLIPLIYGDECLPKLLNFQSDVNKLWGNFKKGYRLDYNTSQEDSHRFEIFSENVKMIMKHNLEHDLGLHTYRLGINKYAAMVIRMILSKRISSFFRFRRTVNIVQNTMDFDTANILVRYIRNYAVYLLQQHLI